MKPMNRAQGELKQSFTTALINTIRQALNRAGQFANTQLENARTVLRFYSAKLESARADVVRAAGVFLLARQALGQLTGKAIAALSQVASKEAVKRDWQRLKDTKQAAFNSAMYWLNQRQREFDAANRKLVDAIRAISRVCRRDVRRRWGFFKKIGNAINNHVIKPAVKIVKKIVDPICQAAKNAAIAALAGLQWALNLARRALDGAKYALLVASRALDQAIRGLQAADYFLRQAAVGAAKAVDDVARHRLLTVAYLTAVHTANGVFNAAQGAVNAAQAAVNVVQAGVQAGLNAANWLLNNAMPVNIVRVAFDFQLSVQRIMDSGFSASVTFQLFNGAPQTVTFSINLRNLWQTAVALAERAFPGLGKLL